MKRPGFLKKNKNIESTVSSADEKNDKKSSGGRSSFFIRLINDNRFVRIVSFILALGVWFLVSMYDSPEDERIISGVPVNINLEDSTPSKLNLQIFGKDEFTVDVTVSGPRYRVRESAFSASDITITANTNYVDSAGMATLALKAVINSTSSDVEIVGLSSSTISVYFDTYKEVEFTVEPHIDTTLDSYVEDGFLNDTPITSISKVKISGASMELDKITNVIASATISERLNTTKTIPTEVTAVASSSLNNDYISLDNTEVTITVPVRKIVTLPVDISFINTPISYISSPLNYSCSPAEVRVAVLTKDLDKISKIVVGTVDFSTINNDINEYTFSTDDIKDIIILDDSIDEFNVSVDASESFQENFTIELSSSNVSIANQPNNVKISVPPASVDVTVIGPQADLDTLDISGITVEIDYSSIDWQDGENYVDCEFVVKTNNSCWCYGEQRIKLEVE